MMPSRSAKRLVLHRETHRIVYRLDGQELNVGDPLEVWTTLGWVLGVFTWDGEPHLPYVSLLKESGVLEPFVILTSSLCRRPLPKRVDDQRR
jgi:hypothetical protein